MKIIKTEGIISNIRDLSKTAKEITLILNDSLDFIPGSFVNIFMDVDGKKIRRAYSISSSDSKSNTITLAMRLKPQGEMSPLFWNKNIIGKKIEVLGPLGLNTVEKMNSEKKYLFAFGIGAGVVKSITEYFENDTPTKSIHIITGSRTEEEIIYKDYFDTMAQNSSKISVEYIISQAQDETVYKKGYIQNHIQDFDFNNSDVYVCGQEDACNTLVQKIKETNPTNCTFLIEGFH